MLSSKKIILTCLFVGAAVFGWFYAKHKDTVATCSEVYRPDGYVQVDKMYIQVQSMVTDAERQQGLSGRSCLGSDQGMLFSFEEAGNYGFWMKNMSFSIDAVWLSSDKKVVTVKSNMSPQSYPTTYTSKNPAKYVLELPAGQASKLGMYEGKTLNF